MGQLGVEFRPSVSGCFLSFSRSGVDEAKSCKDTAVEAVIKITVLSSKFVDFVGEHFLYLSLGVKGALFDICTLFVPKRVVIGMFSGKPDKLFGFALFCKSTDESLMQSEVEIIHGSIRC